jgi:hypothetical protein
VCALLEISEIAGARFQIEASNSSWEEKDIEEDLVTFIVAVFLRCFMASGIVLSKASLVSWFELLLTTVNASRIGPYCMLRKNCLRSFIAVILQTNLLRIAVQLRVLFH